MIITGIFLFLLGTRLGHAAETVVKYEGADKITVIEQKDECVSCVTLPGLGSPPFAPSFFHQGSNFFFNPQIVMPPPSEIISTGIESIIAPQPINEVTILNPEMNTGKIIEKVELLVPELPEIEVDRVPIELIEPNPPVQVLVEEPDVDIEIKDIIPDVPLLIEEPIQPANGLFISEMDVQSVHFNEIPPPPQLPPLILNEIPEPVIVNDNKRIILVPSAPELTMFHPPSMVVAETPLFPVPPQLPPLILNQIPEPVIVNDNKRIILVPSAPEVTMFHPPSMVVAETPLFPLDCAQSIVFERVLPSLAFEYGKTIELISIPASKRAPVVSSIIY